MPHHTGVDLVIGTDFIIPAGNRLDLFNATAKLPDEIAIPLFRSANEVDDTKYGDEIARGPASSLDVESRLYEVSGCNENKPANQLMSY